MISYLYLVVETGEQSILGFQGDLLDRHQLSRILVHTEIHVAAAAHSDRLPLLPVTLLHPALRLVVVVILLLMVMMMVIPPCSCPTPTAAAPSSTTPNKPNKVLPERTREPSRRGRESAALRVRRVAGGGRRRPGAQLPRCHEERMCSAWPSPE